MSHFDFYNHLEDSDELAHWATSCGHFDELDSGYTVTITDLHKIMHKSIQLAPRKNNDAMLATCTSLRMRQTFLKCLHSFLCPEKFDLFNFEFMVKYEFFFGLAGAAAMLLKKCVLGWIQEIIEYDFPYRYLFWITITCTVL